MNRRNKWLQRLNAAQKEAENLRAAVINGETVEERQAAQEALDKVIEKIEDINEILAELDEPADPADPANGDPADPANGDPADPANGSAAGARGLNVLATMQMRTSNPNPNTDRFDSVDYRTAFMNFVCRGVEIPAEYRDTTTTTDASAVIPTTMLKEIVKELRTYGNLYNAVRKLNVQGGVDVPILSLKPDATWIGEGSSSDDKKLQANSSVSFKYFGLECKISQTLLTSVTTLEAFQTEFVNLAAEAIAKALDVAIISGAGTASALGVTVDSRVPSKNVVTLTEEEFTSYSAWKKKVFAKMKKSYRRGNFYMAQATFDGYIDGMVDQNGQPIGRVNYGIDGEEKYRFGGKNIETVEEDVIAAYDDASAGDVVGVFFNPTDYAINSNLEMKVVKWIDHDTNEVKNKAILICDGKLIDPNGVIIIKKG